jgi:hypothetical protein
MARYASYGLLRRFAPRNDDFARRANQTRVGQISQSKSSPFAKNIPLSPSGKSSLQARPSRPTEGRLAIVTDAGRDAVDALVLNDEQRVRRTAKSCGPDAPTLASSSRKATFAGDGGKKARSPGRARRKPLKPLRGECRVFPV